MSDMPERIWFDGLHAWKYDPPNAIGYREFVRADLAPVIGYSRDAREMLVEWANTQGFDQWSMDHRAVVTNLTSWLNSRMTSAAQPRDPAVLVEALEYYAKQRRYGEDGGLAREALAEWKGGLNE
jgi:hypothetical protein